MGKNELITLMRREIERLTAENDHCAAALMSEAINVMSATDRVDFVRSVGEANFKHAQLRG